MSSDNRQFANIDQRHLRHLQQEKVKLHLFTNDRQTKLVQQGREKKGENGSIRFLPTKTCHRLFIEMMKQKLMHWLVPFSGKLIKCNARRRNRQTAVNAPLTLH